MAQVPEQSPILLIISGPAGSGKTTLCDHLLEDYPDQLERIITSTSRPPRPGETDGVDYHFLSPGAFKEGISAGEFIEWAKVHGRYYGSTRSHIRAQLASGKDLLLNIDVQGARTFRGNAGLQADVPGGLHSVFIRPASLEQLRERLHGRGESAEEIERRLHSTRSELEAADDFDFQIISGTREEDYRSLKRYYLNLKKNRP
jgi:guanylate kinase